MVTREHHRARIRLPVRLRWNTPFGQKIELCQTIDVSRGGLLLSSGETHSAGIPLWVTFPYDNSLPEGQPEVLARVVRCGKLPEPVLASGPGQEASSVKGSSPNRPGEVRRSARALVTTDRPATCSLALRFEGPTRAPANGNGAHHDPERRASSRRLLAIPIRVRPERIPWFEEAMTRDFSLLGMRFCSQREYGVGEHLRIALEEEAYAPWTGAREFVATVVRVSPSPGRAAIDVAVCRAQ